MKNSKQKHNLVSLKCGKSHEGGEIWEIMPCEFGEGNGTPLQCSCLENPRDRGAWWAAVCEVTQSQTRLK